MSGDSFERIEARCVKCGSAMPFTWETNDVPLNIDDTSDRSRSLN